MVSLVRQRWVLVGLGLTLTWGCNRNQKENLMIPDVPFGHFKAVETPAMPKVAPSTTESAIRAGKMGQKIIEANKEYGIRPSIHTIGGNQIEIFHRGQDQIFLTEGLVQQASDPQLAAVISLEMAKMVTEREALEGPMTRNFETAPPPEVVMFQDRGGSFGAPDGTYRAELAKYERRRGGPRRKLKLPDPPTLASNLLKKSGFGPDALASAQPLIQRAQEQSAFEKQMRATGGITPVDARAPVMGSPPTPIGTGGPVPVGTAAPIPVNTGGPVPVNTGGPVPVNTGGPVPVGQPIVPGPNPAIPPSAGPPGIAPGPVSVGPVAPSTEPIPPR